MRMSDNSFFARVALCVWLVCGVCVLFVGVLSVCCILWVCGCVRECGREEEEWCGVLCVCSVLLWHCMGLFVVFCLCVVFVCLVSVVLWWWCVVWYADVCLGARSAVCLHKVFVNVCVCSKRIESLRIVGENLHDIHCRANLTWTQSGERARYSFQSFQYEFLRLRHCCRMFYSRFRSQHHKAVRRSFRKITTLRRWLGHVGPDVGPFLRFVGTRSGPLIFSLRQMRHRQNFPMKDAGCSFRLGRSHARCRIQFSVSSELTVVQETGYTAWEINYGCSLPLLVIRVSDISDGMARMHRVGETTTAREVLRSSVPQQCLLVFPTVKPFTMVALETR